MRQKPGAARSSSVVWEDDDCSDFVLLISASHLLIFLSLRWVAVAAAEVDIFRNDIVAFLEALHDLDWVIGTRHGL